MLTISIIPLSHPFFLVPILFFFPFHFPILFFPLHFPFLFIPRFFIILFLKYTREKILLTSTVMPHPCVAKHISILEHCNEQVSILTNMYHRVMTCVCHHTTFYGDHYQHQGSWPQLLEGKSLIQSREIIHECVSDLRQLYVENAIVLGQVYS